MKKSLILIPFIAVVLMLTLTQCKKNYTCGIKVTCNLTTNGTDTGAVVPGAKLVIYPNAVTSGRTVHTAIESAKNATANENGVYEHTYPYEALLTVTADYTNPETNKNYHGTTQIKLQEGEVIEKTVLMMATN